MTFSWIAVHTDRLVLKTGSVTCPMYRGGIGGMLTLAEAHPDTDFMVLHVREARPGERTGHRASLDRKPANAACPWRRLRCVQSSRTTSPEPHTALLGAFRTCPT